MKSSESEPPVIEADLLGSLVDSLPVGAVIWRVEDPTQGAALRMVRPNTAASEASGVDLRQYVGQTMGEAFSAFVEAGIADRILQRCYHEGGVLDLGLIHYKADNVASGAYEVTAYRLDANHLVIQYRNVTERDRLLTELAAQNRELELARAELVRANGSWISSPEWPATTCRRPSGGSAPSSSWRWGRPTSATAPASCWTARSAPPSACTR